MNFLIKPIPMPNLCKLKFIYLCKIIKTNNYIEQITGQQKMIFC